MTQIQDKCEAFDHAWAIWYWLSHWHEGQFSEKYAAMCSIPVENVPSIDFDENDCDEYEETVRIYHELSEDNWEEYYQELMRYLDEEWEDE
jgi:hypothetical protein